MKKGILIVILIALFASLIGISYDGNKNNGIDMKKFIDKMRKEQKVSPEQKKEIRKSIFPNLKDKGN